MTHYGYQSIKIVLRTGEKTLPRGKAFGTY